VHHADFAPLDGTGERALHRVIWLTAVTMVVEIAGGLVFGSLALLADGWHMAHPCGGAGHRRSGDALRAPCGWRPPLRLGHRQAESAGRLRQQRAAGHGVAADDAGGGTRLAQPQPIRFNEALWVAALGLAVNLASAVLLARRDEPTTMARRRTIITTTTFAPPTCT